MSEDPEALDMTFVSIFLGSPHCQDVGMVSMLAIYLYFAFQRLVTPKALRSMPLIQGGSGCSRQCCDTGGVSGVERAYADFGFSYKP